MINFKKGKDMKKPIYKRKWFIALIVIIVVIGVAGAGGGDSDETDKAAGQADSTAVEQAADEKDVPQEYKNALKSAETYSEMMHMSKAAIYDQLISEYGEDFPEDAAQYAIDNLEADWNYNALKSAETYYEEMAMSKSAIYDQLISEYGDQFTAEQAQYAVDHLE